MNIKFYTQKTVQKGKGLTSEEAVYARLKEILANKNSAYHKHLKEGRLQVHKISGSYEARWDLVVITPLEPGGNAVCGNCNVSFFNLGDDYLCDICRELTG